MKYLHFKILSFCTLFVLIFSFNTVNADELVSAQLKSCISGQISYPDFAIENKISGDVTLIFSLDESGKVEVKSIQSDNAELSDYVRIHFSQLDLTHSYLKSDTLYRITISFVLI